MPKKKKKGRTSRDAVSNSVKASGTSATSQKKQSLSTASSVPKPTISSDVISLRLLKGSSGSSSGKKSIKYSPIILLHESDAAKLDVVVGDRVFIISMSDSLPQQIKVLAIARVKTIDLRNDRSSTPRSSPFSGNNNSKRNKLTVGNCHLFPLSLADSFLFCEDQGFQKGPNIVGTPKSFDSTSAIVHTTLHTSSPISLTPSSSQSKFSFAKGGGGDQLQKSPPSKQTPVSSSKSKFSFSKGGGGDQIISPRNSTNNSIPSTPPSIRSKPGNKRVFVQVVPFDSDLGETMALMFCRPAKTLSICPNSTPRNSLVDNQHQEQCSQPSSPASSRTIAFPLCQLLVVAHTAGEYLARGTVFSVSIQGQTSLFKVIDASHDSVINKIVTKGEDDNVLVSNMERLSIEQNNGILDKKGCDTITANDLEESLRSSLSQQNDVRKEKMLLYHVSPETKIVFVHGIGVADLAKAAIAKPVSSPQMIQSDAMVAGLDETIKQVQSAIETPLLYQELSKSSTNTALQPPKGILLYGPSGVGKSALALQVGQNFASKGVYRVERIHCAALQSQTAFVGQAEARLSKLFSDAQKPRPGKKGCLLILDDIHLICSRREGINLGADRLASTLLALLDGIKSDESVASKTEYSTVILAITANPGVLDAALRRPGRLDAEIEVPLPDEPSVRLKILKFQLKSLGAEINFSDSEWFSLARLAKGFTGADLKLAVKDAVRNSLLQGGGKRTITFRTMRKSLLSTKPSAIKAVTVEVPSVPWASIGGMDDVKKQLRDAIELPLTHGATFKRLGIRPPRGVLLYGPPGCSKTLMARALATEGQMNFLAVKGPELLSKWLGESERALAGLFRRARLASPAIIFFDEVDAIASKRGGSSSSGGERLLSQLLTELDGIHQSKDSSGREGRVVIVCATNRPDLLDSALMRPGRIDRMIYVGVPDERSRKNILEIGLKKSGTKNIDIAHLANDEISGGLSGAELIGGCRDAALKAMQDFEEFGSSSIADPIITTEHVVTALTEMERQITPQNLEFYASFQRSSSGQ